ncbi:MAG: AsmA family protein [Alphaproteobacteria bacterium]|nr:AsmA family protein [Alphaproteobacteria bacterium]
MQGSVALAAILLCLTLPFVLIDDPTESILNSYIVRAASQGSFTLSQPLKLLDEPSIMLAKGTLSVGRPNDASPLGSAELAKLIESGREVLILRGGDLVIGGPDGVQQFQLALAPLAKALASGNFRALLIQDSKIRLSVPGGRTILFEDVRVRLRPTAGGRLIAKGNVQYLGRDVEFETIVSTDASSREAKHLPIRAKVSSDKLFSANFQGDLALGNGGGLLAETSSLSIDDVPTMARWLGLAWPSELKLATFKAGGTMEWANQILNFQNGRFQLDSNTATGSLLLNIKGKRPLIDGTLAFNVLDVGKMVDLGELQGTSFLASTVRQTASWLPPRVRQLLSDLNLPILSQLDLDLRVSAKQTIAGSLPLGRTAAALSLHDGNVLVDLAEMELASGGRGNFQVTIDTSKRYARCGLRGSLKQVQAEDLSPLLFPNPIFKGPLDITVDLGGNWTSPEAFIKNLDGKVGLSMPSGVRLAADLPSLIKSVGLDEPAKSGWGKATEGRTDMDTLTADVVFENGEARIDQLKATSSGQDKVSVTGSFNVHKKQLDINVFHRAGEQAPQYPSVLRINGHWDRPQLSKIRFPSEAATPPAFPIPADLFKAPASATGQPARRG